MAKATNRIALGIGPQVDQATPLAAVRDAVDLITGPATGTDATGILLRDNEDLTKGFDRIESDGGRIPGSLSRRSGVLSRIESAVEFTIDQHGNHGTLTPLSGETNFSEYFEQILAGARLDRGPEGASQTQYVFANDPTTTLFKTIKIWRDIESWVLVGCTFNLTFNHSAGEKSTINVAVIADSVIYNNADTFPPNVISDLDTAYGTQRDAAPITELADSQIGGVLRPFQTATLGISYAENEVQDSNVSTGLLKEQGVRTIDFTAGYYEESTTDGDFLFLSDELIQAGQAETAISFQVGVPAVNGVAGGIKGTLHEIPSLRVTGTSKIEGEKVLRTISGYGTISGDSGFGSAIDEEYRLTAH